MFLHRPGKPWKTAAIEERNYFACANVGAGPERKNLDAMGLVRLYCVPSFIMKTPPFCLVASLALAFLTSSLQAADWPVLLEENFTRGSSQWEATDENAWQVKEVEGGNRVYELFGKSDYEPPHRSPFNYSLLKYVTVGDFELTAKVQTTKESYGHRDLCLFFGYQDPAHFYYVHLGQKMDDHANQIFIVNDAPRTKISEKTTEGTAWQDATWHNVKIRREVESGLIEIYFDDMETPVMVAHDKTFVWGRIGLGSFDDIGMFDDVVLKGVEVKGEKAGMPDPKSLKFVKWTEGFEVPDPVSVSLDEKGNAYVTQTQRRKLQDLDIREHRDWIPNDVSFQWVRDKQDFYQKTLAPENSAANQAHVEDLNGDGSHDWRDLTVLSEKIHLVKDTDGDGKADQINVFAEDFKTEVTGIAAGVLYHDGAVYSTIAPDVWKLRDTDGDGKADEREVVAHGFGLHIAYAGHDMHGLTVGPDGRIYWSIGDKGIAVKSKEGKVFHYPNQGGVLRCEPDGSHFEVFAHGLRNVQEVAFDAHGNLFGVDNDSDQAGEMERFVYIVQHSDAGWRCNWQYRGSDFNPWMDEGLWKPYFEGQPAYIVPPIQNYVNGPAGFAFNPGTALSPDYKDYFFVDQFSSGYQNAFQAKEKGASFEMVNDHVIGNGIPLIGTNFGPDGALYAVDWGGGYPLNEKGAVWKIDVPEYADSAIRKETKRLIEEGGSGKEEAELVTMLGHEDQRVRMIAQFELVKRERKDALTKVARDESADPLARLHAIWGIGQLLRYDADATYAELTPLAKAGDAEVRAQAAKTIGEGSTNQPVAKYLVPLLKDPNARVRFQAALALGNLEAPEATEPLIEFISGLEPDQVYLRHAGVHGLTGCAYPDTLAGLADHASEAVRLAACLALRNRADAAITAYLNDASEIVATEAARGIHDDWTIPDAMPALAALVENPPYQNESLLRRAIGANFRLGGEAEVKRVAEFAANGEMPKAMRMEAIDALLEWPTPPVLDRVDGRYRPLEARDVATIGKAAASSVDALLQDADVELREAGMALATELNIQIEPGTLLTVVEDQEAPSGLRLQALKTLSKQAAKGEATHKAIDAGLAAKDASLRAEARSLLAKTSPEKAIPLLKEAVNSDKAKLPERQQALLDLAATAKPEADELILDWMRKLTDGKAPRTMALDILTAAEGRAKEAPDLQKALDAFETARAKNGTGSLVDSASECLEGGDATRGKKVFTTHLSAQCTACHKVKDGKGSNVGPNLKSVGAKNPREFLLESLLNPQAKIAKGYGTIMLTLKSGDLVSGQFREETDQFVELRDAEGESIKVPLEDIENRTPVISSMPPMLGILNKHELRDVVEYLSTLKAK